MTTIKIQDFAGELPRVSPRSLGAAAQTNKNLLTTSTEFRPLLADSTVASGTNNAVTLYRLSRDSSGNLLSSDAAGWITSIANKNYVKGQINDDATERTYVTFNDGSAPPRVIDATGQDRLLGVPKPTGLTAAATLVNQYTADEDSKARTNIPIQLKEAVIFNATTTVLGDGPPLMSPGADAGWIQHGTAVSVGTLPTANAGEYAFAVKMSASASGGYVPPDQYKFLTATEFAGTQITYGGSVYWAFPIAMRGIGYAINSGTLATALMTILNPDVDGPAYEVRAGYTNLGQLYSDAGCTEVALKIQADYAATSEPQKSSIAAINAAQMRMKSAIGDYLNVGVQTSGVKDFYATTTPTAEITAAINHYASRILLALQLAYGTDAGTGVAADVSTAVKASIIALFPSTFTVAGVGSNTRISFATDGTLQANASAIRSGVDAILQAELTTDATLLMDPLAVLRSVLVEMDNIYTNELVNVIGPDHWKAKYPSTYPLGSSYSPSEVTTNRLSVVLKSIADLKIAADRITNDYATLNAKLADILGNIFDAKGGIAESLPEIVTRIVENRSYIATHVTDWGEESAPCDPTASVELDQNDTVALTLPTPPSGRNLAHWRLYRTNSGANSAAFQFVAEIAIGTLTYTDTVKSGDLGEVCPSIGPDGLAHWDEPATRLGNNGLISAKENPYLRGMVGMPNGIMAGFVDNFVAFCDPYHPYAWPIAYQVTVEYPIAGLGVFGQTLFVGTVANPYFIRGADSASMSAEKLDSAQACVSARSIVSAAGGVLYASPDGICFASSNGVEVITTALFAREDWQALTPSSIKAVMHEGVYYFAYSGTYGGVTGGCLALDSVARKLGRVDLTATALFADALTDAVFYVSGTSVKRAFATGRRTGTWKSGKVVAPSYAPFAWLQVDGDQSGGTPVTVRWTGDGGTPYVTTVTSTTPQRLPPGRYLEHEIEIESAARVTKVMLAGDTQELKSA